MVSLTLEKDGPNVNLIHLSLREPARATGLLGGTHLTSLGKKLLLHKGHLGSRL